MSNEQSYEGREQSLVKHLILRHYLQRFAYIIGFHWKSITYIDCFSGPWESKSKTYADTSFGIAISELRKARDELATKHNKQVKVRCFFLEKSRSAFDELQKFVATINDIEIETRNAALEESVDQIVKFAKQGGGQSFPFVFIDPKGWTGFALDVIQPLLSLKPGEVLINFMTSHIRRFIDSPDAETQESFERLFGSGHDRKALSGREGIDRDDAAVFEYLKNVKQAGGFGFGSPAVVLHPEINRSHFHLIYLTRDPKGIEVFKDAEHLAMKDMESARARAKQSRREQKTRQKELFAAEEVHNPEYFDGIRDHYLKMARNAVLAELTKLRRISYDDLWATALSFPMIWESDLKLWISEWKASDQLTVEGMKERQRVPRRGEDNVLVWNG